MDSITSALPTSSPPRPPPQKKVLLSLLCGDLHVASHGYRPQITILCWSCINPPLLGKYLTVYLFQVSTLVTRLGTREDPWGPWDWWADLKPLSLIAFLTNPGVQTYAFLLDLSLQPVCVWSSPGVIWGLFKGFDFRVKTLFCVLVLVWHFHLTLRSDCFNW